VFLGEHGTAVNPAPDPFIDTDCLEPWASFQIIPDLYCFYKDGPGSSLVVVNQPGLQKGVNMKIDQSVSFHPDNILDFANFPQFDQIFKKAHVFLVFLMVTFFRNVTVKFVTKFVTRQPNYFLRLTSKVTKLQKFHAKYMFPRAKFR
jgi:hypothetical protein